MPVFTLSIIGDLPQQQDSPAAFLRCARKSIQLGFVYERSAYEAACRSAVTAHQVGMSAIEDTHLTEVGWSCCTQGVP